MPSRFAKHRLRASKLQQGHCYYYDLLMWLRHPDEIAGGLGVRPPPVTGLQCTAERLVALHGAVRIIARIQDPDVIEKTLTHLNTKATAPEAPRRPPYWVPPQAGLFD